MPEYSRTNNGVLVPKGYSSSPPANAEGPREFLAPLMQQWKEKIELAYKAKLPFDEVAFQCDSFFAKSSGFMWKDRFLT